MLKKISFIMTALAIIMLYFTGCTQPIQPEPGQPSNETKLSFNYSMTGAFDTVVNRSSGDQYSAKMYMTELTTSKTTVHPWTIFIDRDRMMATSYNILTISPGKYSFELVVSKGEFNYHAKSGAIEIKEGDNNIPLQLSPVIGDFIVGSATVTDLDKLGDLMYRFSTLQLASITDPRLGYSINGQPEVIIKINKTTGLAPVKVNLPHGFHPVKLNFYEGTTLLGASKDGRNIFINPAYALNKTSIDIYPLYGNITLKTTLVDGKANFTIETLPRQLYDVMAARGGVTNEGIKAKVTLQYADYFTKKEFLLQADASGDHSGTALVEGLKPGRANIIIDLSYETYDDSSHRTVYLPVARSVTESVELGKSSRSIKPEFQIFSNNYVETNLKSIVNVSLFNYEGDPIIGQYSFSLELYADGAKVYEQHKVGHAIHAVLNSDTKLLEVRYDGKTVVKAFQLALKPFETRNIEYTMPPHYDWHKIPADQPNPFHDIVKLNDKDYRLVTKEIAGQKELFLEESGRYSWSKATPAYSLSSDESIEPYGKSYTVDSKGQLYIIITNSPDGPKKIIRLKSDLTAWELMPYSLPSGSYDIFSTPAGELFTAYNFKSPKFKRLKADGSGWEEFKTAAVPEKDYPGSHFSLSPVGTIFTDRKGNFCLEAQYGPSSYLLKYDRATDSWKKLFKTAEQKGNYRINYTLDSKNNFHVTTFYSRIGGAPPGMPKPYYSDYYVAKYDANGTVIYDNHVKSWQNEGITTLSLLTKDSNSYILVSSDRVAPYIAVTRDGVTAIDEELSQYIPLPGYGFQVKMGVGKYGWLYLEYHNKSTGQTYYYQRY